MAANLSKWLKYAQAKLNSAVSSSNAELDELEAEQRAAAEDKPWLSSDGDAPTLEEARARIEWEAEEQRRQAEAPAAPSTPSTPSTPAEDSEAAQARMELDQRAEDAKVRLDEIRKELGVDPPA